VANRLVEVVDAVKELLRSQVLQAAREGSISVGLSQDALALHKLAQQSLKAGPRVEQRRHVQIFSQRMRNGEVVVAGSLAAQLGVHVEALKGRGVVEVGPAGVAVGLAHYAVEQHHGWTSMGIAGLYSHFFNITNTF